MASWAVSVSRRGEIGDGEIGVVRSAFQNRESERCRGRGMPEQREREKETERHERYLIEGERKNGLNKVNSV